MTGDPQGRVYLYACLDRNTGTPIGTFGSDGRRAEEFARNTGTLCVRWQVQWFESKPEWGLSGGHWHAGN